MLVFVIFSQKLRHIRKPGITNQFEVLETQLMRWKGKKRLKESRHWGRGSSAATDTEPWLKVSTSNCKNQLELKPHDRRRSLIVLSVPSFRRFVENLMYCMSVLHFLWTAQNRAVSLSSTDTRRTLKHSLNEQQQWKLNFFTEKITFDCWNFALRSWTSVRQYL